MDTKIRVWLDDDRDRIHHASSQQVTGMESPPVDGVTDCALRGLLTLVHHEHVDMGILCEACMVVSGPNPALAGEDNGPV